MTVQTMFARERQVVILDRLARDGKVLANELAREFSVSEDTIRRDLRDLAKAGACRKVYGGALAGARAAGRIGERMQEAVAGKSRLAAAAAELVRAGQTILIDAGSTNVAIAAALPRDMPLTIVTNAPAVATTLAEHSLARIVVLGGLYDRDIGACLGGTTLRELEHVNADLFFLGACGVDGTVGVTAFNHAEAEVKRAMLRRSTRLAVATTSDKIPAVAPFQVGGPDAISHLVVESDVDAEVLDALRRHGVQIEFAA